MIRAGLGAMLARMERNVPSTGEDPAIHAVDDGVIIDVYVQPGATRAAQRGRHGDAFKISVTEPAREDRANRALERFLAELFGLRASQVTVRSGHTSRSKRVHLRGVGRDEAARCLCDDTHRTCG